MTIDIERLKQRCDHADGGDDPCDLVLDTRTVRELIAIAERHDELAAHIERTRPLLYSICGDCYMGEKWEQDLTRALLDDDPQDSLVRLKADALRKEAMDLMSEFDCEHRLSVDQVFTLFRERADEMASGGES